MQLRTTVTAVLLVLWLIHVALMFLCLLHDFFELIVRISRCILNHMRHC